MKTIVLLVASTISLSASSMFLVTPYELLFTFPGDEKLEVVTQGAKLKKVIVKVGDAVMQIPEAELKDLPSVFVETIRYEMAPSSSRREVSFDAGERGDWTANPPIPAKIIHITLCFGDGAYVSRMTETPTDDSTSEVRMKKVGEAEMVRATIKKQPPIPIQKVDSKGESPNHAEQPADGNPPKAPQPPR